MADHYSIRVERAGEIGETDAMVRQLYWQDRGIALFTDNEFDEHDSKQTLEALNRYWDLLDAVRDLVFLVGQLPSAKTIADQELNRAYVRASDFLREEHERRVALQHREPQS